ncbi:hypothetical protein COT48_03650, partial [Candidatus Woesearchaeota archaeon CG08_land_8_20_14_0_20_47_9]
MPNVDSVRVVSNAPNPEKAYKNSTLTCQNSSAYDMNGDNITMIYQWYVNGQRLEFSKLAMTASASSSDGSHPPEDAADSNTASYWISVLGWPQNAWWQGYLGAVRNISYMRYLFTGSSADNYHIQYSLDGSTFYNLTTAKTEYETCEGSNLWNEVTVPMIEAAYIRFYFTNPNNDEGLGGLAEVEVYENLPRLNSTYFSSGDYVTCIITAHDGMQNGTTVNSTTRDFTFNLTNGQNISTLVTSDNITLGSASSGWWYSPVYDFGNNYGLRSLNITATAPVNTAVLVQSRTGADSQIAYSEDFSSYGNASKAFGWRNAS